MKLFIFKKIPKVNTIISFSNSNAINFNVLIDYMTEHEPCNARCQNGGQCFLSSFCICPRYNSLVEQQTILNTNYFLCFRLEGFLEDIAKYLLMNSAVRFHQ